MLHLHRTLLVAPFLLSLACNGGGGSTATESSTSDTTSTTDGPGPTTTTNDPTTPGTTTSATEPDPTTGATTSTTGMTTVPGTTTTGETDTGEEVACEGTPDCPEGQVCWAPYTDMMGEFSCHAECVDDAGSGNFNDVWCFDDAACCTAGAVCDAEGYCVEDPGMTTNPDTDSSGSDSSGTESSDTGTETGTETGTTGTTGDTDGGLLPSITLMGLTVTANCQPVVPEDPVTAKWTAIFDNDPGLLPFTADVTSATLTYSPGNGEFVQGISVTPMTSGMVGANKVVMKAMSKTKALMNLPMDCGQCDKPVALEVVFDVDGVEVVTTAEAVMTCVF